MTMATMAPVADVISLDMHSARRSNNRRSDEFLAAMRRHPSYQGPRHESHDDRDSAVVLSFRRR